MSSYSERIRTERKRLGKTQDEFAGIAGVTRNPYCAWEKGATAPDARQLAALAQAGVDVQYVITGVRSDVALAPEERRLLEGFRSSPQSLRDAALRVLAEKDATQAPVRATGENHDAGKDAAVTTGSKTTPGDGA